LGSDVEITVIMEEFGSVRVQAYIPGLDEVYEKVIKLNKPSADPRKLV
jgi:hypothetical protein